MVAEERKSKQHYGEQHDHGAENLRNSQSIDAILSLEPLPSCYLLLSNVQKALCPKHILYFHPFRQLGQIYNSAFSNVNREGGTALTYASFGSLFLSLLF